MVQVQHRSLAKALSLPVLAEVSKEQVTRHDIGKQLHRRGSGGPGGASMCEQCAIATKKAYGVLGCTTQSIACR